MISQAKEEYVAHKRTPEFGFAAPIMEGGYLYPYDFDFEDEKDFDKYLIAYFDWLVKYDKSTAKKIYGYKEYKKLKRKIKNEKK